MQNLEMSFKNLASKNGTKQASKKASKQASMTL